MLVPPRSGPAGPSPRAAAPRPLAPPLARSAVLALAACAATPEPLPAPPPLSQAEGEARYDALWDEHQRAIAAWSAQVEAARGTDGFEATWQGGQAIARRFLVRFEALAARGYCRAKVDVLDFLGHLVPHEEARVDAALDDLAELVREHADAAWIADLADDDVLRYLLQSERRDEALALYGELVARTQDDEARRALLLQLGLARLRDPRGPADREAGLTALDRVVRDWPGSHDAEWARRELVFERELAVGRPMPPLEGRDVDGDALRLADLRGQVVVVEFFGFW